MSIYVKFKNILSKRDLKFLIPFVTLFCTFIALLVAKKVLLNSETTFLSSTHATVNQPQIIRLIKNSLKDPKTISQSLELMDEVEKPMKCLTNEPDLQNNCHTCTIDQIISETASEKPGQCWKPFTLTINEYFRENENTKKDCFSLSNDRKCRYSAEVQFALTCTDPQPDLKNKKSRDVCDEYETLYFRFRVADMNASSQNKDQASNTRDLTDYFTNFNNILQLDTSKLNDHHNCVFSENSMRNNSGNFSRSPAIRVTSFSSSTCWNDSEGQLHCQKTRPKCFRKSNKGDP